MQNTLTLRKAAISSSWSNLTTYTLGEFCLLIELFVAAEHIVENLWIDFALKVDFP